MEQTLAEYIATTAGAADRTHTASDRPVYAAHLADAAILLARAVQGASAAELRDALHGHDRLRGHTWLQGPERADADAAWERVVRQAPGVRAT